MGIFLIIKNQIIKNCVLLLKKLHTLILGISSDKSLESNLYNNKQEYLDVYPELKDSNIKFCYFSKLEK